MTSNTDAAREGARRPDGRFGTQERAEGAVALAGPDPDYDAAGTPVEMVRAGDLRPGDRFVYTPDLGALYGSEIVIIESKGNFLGALDFAVHGRDYDIGIDADTLVRRVGPYANLVGELGKGSWVVDDDEVRQVESVDGDNSTTGIEFVGYDRDENGEPEGYFYRDVPNDTVFETGCQRHGGVWGSDTTCAHCCEQDGTVRSPFRLGPLADPTPDQSYCDVGRHQQCSGYTEDEADPESCMCTCHDQQHDYAEPGYLSAGDGSAQSYFVERSL